MSSTLSRTAKSALAALALVACLGAPAVADATDATGVTGGSGTISDPWNPTRAAHISCDSATLFANYSASGGHRDPIATLYRGNYIGVRYITSNNYSADVFWHGTSRWGFVLRSCFTLN